MKNKEVTLHDRGPLIVNLSRIYEIFIDGYPEELQAKLGIKLLWVSDSIIASAPIENASAIINVLLDITNFLYCSGLSLRGVITVGQLYHKSNVWGPALIEAVRNEKEIVKYPRILISESHLLRLKLDEAITSLIFSTITSTNLSRIIPI